MHVFFTLILFFSSELRPELWNFFILFSSYRHHNHRQSHYRLSSKISAFIRHLTIQKLSEQFYPSHQYLLGDFHLAYLKTSQKSESFNPKSSLSFRHQIASRLSALQKLSSKTRVQSISKRHWRLPSYAIAQHAYQLRRGMLSSYQVISVSQY